MATFYVLNNKKYRTSVRLRDGRLEAIRFEPEVYFGGIGQSTYTTSDQLSLQKKGAGGKELFHLPYLCIHVSSAGGGAYCPFCHGK